MKTEGSRGRAAPIVNEGLRSRLREKAWSARVWVLWDGRARAGAGVGGVAGLAAVAGVAGVAGVAEILSFRLWLLDWLFLPF